MVDMPLGDEIAQVEPVALAQAVVDDDQLDLHFIGQDVFDVDAHRLPGVQVGAGLGKAGQIGGDLHKGAVFLHAPHNAHHGLTHGEPGGVLLPGAQQLPDGQHEPPLHIPAFDGAQDLLAHTHPVGRGGDAADRHAVDGQQGADAAPNVTKGTKRLDVGHSAGQDVPGL